MNQLQQGLGALLIIFILASSLSFFFEEEIQLLTRSAVTTLGFSGLAFLAIFSDTVISPISPDLILFIIAKSHLAADWPVYLSIICICSLLGGHIGFFLGRLIQKKAWAPNIIMKFVIRKKQSIESFGTLTVILGALTPLPFSITCWSAGFLQLSYNKFIFAIAFRIPRIIITYFIISDSTLFAEWIKQFF